MKLTNDTIGKLKLLGDKSERLEFDKDLPGFGLRLRAGGKRTWIVQYRTGAKQRRMTIGTPAMLDANAARKRARELLAQAQLGHDPQAQKKGRKEQASETFGRLVELYLPNAGTRRERPIKPKSLAEIVRYLRVLCQPLHGLPVTQVTRKAITDRLRAISVENGPIAANRAQDALSAMFSWAIGDGQVEMHQNPMPGTNRMAKEMPRERVLTDAELRLIWEQAGADDYGRIVKLLMLTAQRRDEIGSMAWPEVEGELWTIPAERAKNGAAHEVPLASEAAAILAGVMRREERKLIFGAGEGGFSGWSKAKAALDARMLAALRRDDAKAELAPWRLHDLRRTAATRAADELSVPPHVVEAILNHLPTRLGRTYNKATYRREKGEALALWNERLMAIVGRISNVVMMSRQA